MPKESLLPVIIGVTGHRDIRPDALAPVREAVRVFFADLRRRLPNTPIVLLSPLAEGADRLAAEAFLEGADAERGDRLVAPLPLPLEEYRRDFDTPESNEQFDRLRAAAEVVQLPLLPGTDLDEVRGFSHARDLHYEQVGILVARNAHILLALWDQRESNGRGGTGDIVRYRLQGIPAAQWARQIHLDPPETGPVQHIHTPRSTGPSSNVPPGESTLLMPREWQKHAPQIHPFESLQLVERFNADAREFLTQHGSDVSKCMGYLWHDGADLPPLRPAEQHIRSVYSVADAMAVHYQRKWKRMTKLLLWIGFGVLVLGAYYADFEPTPDFAAPYLASLVLATLTLLYLNRAGWQDRYLRYRALAEGLRVQFFWRLAGIRQSVTDSYLRVQREELHGIRQAIRFADLDIGDSAMTPRDWALRLSAVRERWVADQQRYFIRANARDNRLLKWLNRLKALAFALGAAGLALTATAHFAIAALRRLEPGTLIEPLRELALRAPSDPSVIGQALAAGSLFLAAAAAFAAYIELLALDEHTQAARKMGELYGRADERLRHYLAAPDSDSARHQQNMQEARAIIHEIGLEALAENGDWFIMHQERSAELPIS